MPSRSQAQRAYLYAHFGSAWVHRHGFANRGPLPEHVAKIVVKRRKKRRKR